MSWGDAEVFVHVYKRVEQSNEQGESRFICAYKDCYACVNGMATDPLDHDQGSSEKIGTLKYNCVLCDQKRLPAPRRRTLDTARASSGRSFDYSNGDDDDDGIAQQRKRKKGKCVSDGLK